MVLDTDWSTAAALGGLLLLFGLLAVGPLSVADQRNQITFYHLSPDAGSITDSLQEKLQKKYPGTFTDTAQIDRYTFEVSTLYSDDDACVFEPVVKRDGEVIDDYDTSNPIRKGADGADRTQTYGELEATHGEVIYLQNYWGRTRCKGTFSTYRLPVDTYGIDVSVDVPDEAVAGEDVTATVAVTNTWKPLQANLTTELCVDGTFCTTKQRTNIELDRGRTTIAIPYDFQRAGQLSADVSGPIGLDMDHYLVSGVSVDCDRDGRMEDGARCETITVGQMTGSGVTTVKSTTAALFDTDLIADAIKLELAKVRAWLERLV